MDNTLIKRKTLFNYYTNKFHNSDKDDYRQLFKKIKVIGKGGQGKVYQYSCKNCTTDTLAVKKFYLDEKTANYIEDQFNRKALTLGNYIESASSQLVNILLLQKKCPNFVFNYTTQYIERDGICSDSYPYNGFHYNEYIDDAETFSEWVLEEHSDDKWYNAYFQILIAIYALQIHFNMKHFDLHADNILVKKIKSGGYWKYIINDKEYNIPNLGYIFYIVDFGHAFIPGKFKSWFATGYRYVKNSFDIEKLYKSTLKTSTASKPFKKELRMIIKQLKNKISFVDVFEKIFLKKYNYKKKTGPIEIYQVDKKLKKINYNLPKELSSILKN